MFDPERSAKLVNRWLRLKPKKIKPDFCAINHNRYENRANCDRNINDIIKPSVIKVEQCKRPRSLEVSRHILRVGTAQDLLTKGYDLAAIMRAGGQIRVLFQIICVLPSIIFGKTKVLLIRASCIHD